MLHPLYPTDVLVPDSDSSEVPEQIDTTVQGPSVADFAGMCNNDFISDIEERETYQNVTNVIDVCTSEEDLARAIKFYNECIERDARAELALSTALVDGATLSLSCSKSASNIMLPKPTNFDKAVKVKIETKIQCPSNDDFSDMMTCNSERDIVQCTEFGNRECCDSCFEILQKNRNCDSENDVSNKDHHYLKKPKTSGQGTSNPSFEVQKPAKKALIELKSSMKKSSFLRKLEPSKRIDESIIKKTSSDKDYKVRIHSKSVADRIIKLNDAQPPHVDCCPDGIVMCREMPYNVEITCPPRNPCGHTCTEPSTCCNDCCKSKSDPSLAHRWAQPGDSPNCGNKKDSHCHTTFFKNGFYNFRLQKVYKDLQNRFPCYAILGCSFKKKFHLNSWIWALLIAIGTGLLLAGFGIGYLVGHSNSKMTQKMEYENVEPVITGNNALYIETTTEEQPLIFVEDDKPKNRSQRRNLPTLMPYVSVPFVPNKTWSRPTWTWRCVEKRCQRIAATVDVPHRSLHTCNMLCDIAKLWPKPTVSMSFATTVAPVRADQFSLEILSSPSEIVRQHLNYAFQLLQADLLALEKNLTKPPVIELGPPRAMMVRVAVKGNADVRMKTDTDESYRLSTSNTGDLLTADIRASSFCGARHAFETLSQLVWAEPAGATLLALESVDIKDTPRFQYRGLLLDTSQNFIKITDIFRTVDAMGASKLNTFHWHISDTQSFPLHLNSVPQLAEYGSFDSHSVYTTDDVSAVVRRARLRGIRVILEIDLPNAGRAWNWKNETDLGILALCIEAQPWQHFCYNPPCGYLNVGNPRIYEILEKIYREIIELTGVDDVFHLGWSGNPEKCWQSHIKNVEVVKLWSEFMKRALSALKRAHGGTKPKHTIVWSPQIVDKTVMQWMVSQGFDFQVWNYTSLLEKRHKDIRTILSPWNKYYLDCRTFINCTRSMISWQEMYEFRPWMGESSWRVLGAEVCLWNQPTDLDRHLWPKGMVLAERLWSDPTTPVDSTVFMRLDLHRQRLLTRGIGSESIWHAWCTNNPYDCVKP